MNYFCSSPTALFNNIIRNHMSWNCYCLLEKPVNTSVVRDQRSGTCTHSPLQFVSPGSAMVLVCAIQPYPTQCLCSVRRTLFLRGIWVRAVLRHHLSESEKRPWSATYPKTGIANGEYIYENCCPSCMSIL